MDVALIGDWEYDHYEAALGRALEDFGGVRVLPIVYSLGDGVLNRALKKFADPFTSSLAEQRIRSQLGPTVNPDVALIWRGNPISGRFLEEMRQRKRNCVWMFHHNDNIFTPANSGYRTRRIRSAVPLYECILCYRMSDMVGFRELGARSVELWLPSYDEATISPSDRPVHLRPTDVSFVGHFEDDGRREVIKALSSGGFNVDVYGKGWPDLPCVRRRDGAWGDEYSQVLSNSKIVLSFHSALNQDKYTRRTFEIPYSGAVMLTPPSFAISQWFSDKESALFYSSPEEAIQAVAWGLEDLERLESIRKAGKRRVTELRASTRDRAAQFLRLAHEFNRLEV